MIQKEQNEQVQENIIKIIERSQQIKKLIKITLQYMYFTQQQYSFYCKDIFYEMTNFEKKITTTSLYEPDKTNMILKLSKLYRSFPAQIQNYSEVNLIKLPRLSQLQQLNKYSQKLNKKQGSFQTQFKNYLNTINKHNITYQKYISQCNVLDQIISKFKSYSDPLKFYDKSITSQYQQRLQIALNRSKNQQTKLITQLQILDSKREFLDEIVKQISEFYTSFFHRSLNLFYSIMIQLITINNKMEIKTFNNKLFTEEMGQQSSINKANYQVQFQRLNNLKRSIIQENQIIAHQHKLFNVRCDSLKQRKQRAFKQTLNLQQNLVDMLALQIKNYKEFEKKCKERQRKIFGIAGKDSYKKQFQYCFGTKSSQLNEFCFNIVQMPRKSFEKINIWMVENLNVLKEIVETKKQQMIKFNNLYDQIMTQHLKQKQKYEIQGTSNNQVISSYRTNIISFLDQFKYIFSDFEAKQFQKDKIVADKLIQMYRYVIIQYNQCRIQNVIQKNKTYVVMINNFNIINLTMQVFKSEQLYSILYQDFFVSSLKKKFRSKINQQDYKQAQVILKQKQKITKKMLKRQIVCCGFVKAQPIQSQILAIHKCYLQEEQKCCAYGYMKILKQGLIFEQLRWNICAQKVFILIPNSDIRSFDPITLKLERFQKICQGVSIETEKGPLIFFTKHFDQFINDLNRIYGLINRKNMLIDKKIGSRNNDSTSSGSKRGKVSSMIIGFNKQKNQFVQEPICFNPNFSKVSNKKVQDSQYRFSGGTYSNFSSGSYVQQIIPQRDKIKSEGKTKKQKQLFKTLQVLLLHLEKHQFLPQKFIYILNKDYKSKQRKDYQFKDRQTYNEFVLKQLKQNKLITTLEGVLLYINYEWKVTYPNNVSLHSFKHGQKIIIDLNSQPPTISIIEWPHLKQQNFNRHVFYEQIKIMNKNICNYIVQNTNKNFMFETLIQKQNTSQADDSKDFLNEQVKSERISYPQQLDLKYSKVNSYIQDLKKSHVPSIEQIHLKKITPDQKMIQSSNIDSGYPLVRGINL